MNLDDLQRLPVADQQTFLLGRITAETVRMDVALRFLNGTLRGKRDFDSYMDAPDGFSANARECQRMLSARTAPAEENAAILAAITSAKTIYTVRNGYVHRFLRRSLIDREHWELAHVSRKGEDIPDPIPVSFDVMVGLVLDIVAVTHRLRAAGMQVLLEADSTWSDELFGTVQGRWDGSVEWIA